MALTLGAIGVVYGDIGTRVQAIRGAGDAACFVWAARRAKSGTAGIGKFFTRSR